MHAYFCQTCQRSWLDERPPVPGPLMADPWGRPVPSWLFPPCPWCRQYHVQYMGQPQFPAMGPPPVRQLAPPLMTGGSQPGTSTQPSPGLNHQAKAFTPAHVPVRPPSPVQPPPQALLKPTLPAKVVNLSDPFEVLPKELLKIILSQLDRKSLKLVSLVCSKWRDFGVAFLREFVPRMVAHGSAVAPLQPIILRELASARTLQLAVDKVPYSSYSNDSILEYILRKRIPVQLLLGSKDDRTLDLLNRAAQSAAVAIEDVHRQFNKMHNKIWVLDDDGVITGSPNISYTAMHSNVESMIVIRNKDAAALFTRYIRLLRSATPTSGPEYKSLQQALAKYNREDRGLKIAMAPLVNITDFVVEQLADATKIVVRQFLISPSEPGGGPDILKALCAMAGAGVDISVYIDEEQYRKMGFVKLAVNALIGSGVKVYTQALVHVINTNNENCVHDKLILAELRSGVRVTLIGSAGFTTDVIANQNAENFIWTDARTVHDSLTQHHQAVLRAHDTVRVSQIQNYARTPQWVKEKFTQDWLQEFI